MKKYSVLLYIYIFSIVLSTIIHISSFWINGVNLLDFLFFKSFISILFSILIVLLLVFVIKNKFFPNYKIIVWQDYALIFFISLFLNWFVYGLIPFNVSRSNSIILLKYLYDNKGESKSKIQIQNFVENKYFNTYDAIGHRLSEQISAGNIQEVQGQFFITPKGIFVADVFLGISRLYNLNNNFLED
jgi:hypothetical protein